MPTTTRRVVCASETEAVSPWRGRGLRALRGVPRRVRRAVTHQAERHTAQTCRSRRRRRRSSLARSRRGVTHVRHLGSRVRPVRAEALPRLVRLGGRRVPLVTVAVPGPLRRRVVVRGAGIAVPVRPRVVFLRFPVLVPRASPAARRRYLLLVLPVLLLAYWDRKYAASRPAPRIRRTRALGGRRRSKRGPGRHRLLRRSSPLPRRRPPTAARSVLAGVLARPPAAGRRRLEPSTLRDYRRFAERATQRHKPPIFLRRSPRSGAGTSGIVPAAAASPTPPLERPPPAAATAPPGGCLVVLPTAASARRRRR